MLVSGSKNRPSSEIQLEKQKLKDEVRRRLRAEKALRELLMAQPVRDREDILEIIEHLHLGEYEYGQRIYQQEAAAAEEEQQQEQEDDWQEISPETVHAPSRNIQRSVLFDQNRKSFPVAPSRGHFAAAQKTDILDSQKSTSFKLFLPEENGSPRHQEQQVLAQEGDLIRELKESLHVTRETVILQRQMQSDLEAESQQQRERLKHIETENHELLSQSKIQQAEINRTSSQLDSIQLSFSEEKQKTEQLRANLLQEQYNVEHWKEEFEKLRMEFERLKYDFEQYKSEHLSERENFQASYTDLERSLEIQLKTSAIQEEAIEKLTEEKNQVIQQSELWQQQYFSSEGNNDVLKVQVVKAEKLRGEYQEAVEKLTVQLQQSQDQIKNIVLLNQEQNKEKIGKEEAAEKLMDVWSEVFCADMEKFRVQQTMEKQQEQIEQLEKQILLFGKESEIRQKSDEKLSEVKQQLQNFNSKQNNPQLLVDNSNLSDNIKQIISQMSKINAETVLKFEDLIIFLDNEDSDKTDLQKQNAFINSQSALNLLSEQHQHLSEQIKMLLEDSETKMEDYLHLFKNKVQLLQLLDDFEQMKKENESQVLLCNQKYEYFEKLLDSQLEQIKQGKIVVPLEQPTGQLDENSGGYLVNKQFDLEKLEELQGKLAVGIVQVQQKLQKVQVGEPERVQEIVDDLSALNEQLGVVKQQLMDPTHAQEVTNQDYAIQQTQISAEILEADDGKVHLNLSEVPQKNYPAQILSPTSIASQLQQSQSELQTMQKDAQYLSSNLLGEYDAPQLEISLIKTDLIKKIAQIIQKLTSQNQKLEQNNKELEEVKKILDSEMRDSTSDASEHEKAKSSVAKLIQILQKQKIYLKELVLQIQNRNENIDELYSQLRVLYALNEQLNEQLQDSQEQMFEMRQMYEMKVNDCEQLQRINKKLESTCEKWTDQGRNLLDQLGVVTDAHAKLHTQIMLQGKTSPVQNVETTFNQHQDQHEEEEEQQQQLQIPDTPTRSASTNFQTPNTPQIENYQTPNTLLYSPSSQINDSAYQPFNLEQRGVRDSPYPTLDIPPHLVLPEERGEGGLGEIDSSESPEHIQSYLEQIKQSMADFHQTDSIKSSEAAFGGNESSQPSESVENSRQGASVLFLSCENLAGLEDSEVLEKDVVARNENQEEEEEEEEDLNMSQIFFQPLVSKEQDGQKFGFDSSLQDGNDLFNQSQSEVEYQGPKEQERTLDKNETGFEQKEVGDQNLAAQEEEKEISQSLEVGVEQKGTHKMEAYDLPPRKLIHLDGSLDVKDAQNAENDEDAQNVRDAQNAEKDEDAQNAGSDVAQEKLDSPK